MAWFICWMSIFLVKGNIMDILAKYIVNMKRKLCTVCIGGVHYEYVGSQWGEDHSYAEHCPCDNQSIRALIRERLGLLIRTKRSKIPWH